MAVYKDMVDLIGRTPLVRINKMVSNPEVELYAKLEKYNPTHSVKDRIARFMIEHAEKDGSLNKDKIVIEPTSGNTGIGLAVVCAAKGYRLELVMPETMSMERRKILTAYGAKIILSPGDQGMDGAEDLATSMVEENPGMYFRPNQFDNELNVRAHYKTTAVEVWEDTGGSIDVFVAGMGTSGTLMGVSKRLKELKPEVKIVGVEPYPKSKIQGLKNMDTQYVPKIYDPLMLDKKVNVSDDDAFETARMLTIREGIFSGISSGAAMYAAIREAEGMKEGVAVVVLPDGGEKYISTVLYDPIKCMECINRCGIASCITPEYMEGIKEWYEL